MNWNFRYAKEKESKGFKPPAGVQSAAKHALKLIEEGKAGDGFTSVGRHRAHQLAAGEMVPLSDVKRMHSYFSRHAVDKKGKDWDHDSPGKVAWLAWGGDAGKAWAASIVKKHGGGEDNKKEASNDWHDRHHKKVMDHGFKCEICDKQFLPGTDFDEIIDNGGEATEHGTTCSSECAEELAKYIADAEEDERSLWNDYYQSR